MESVFSKWAADIRRRSFKDGVEMPLSLLALGLCGEAAEVAEATHPWRLNEVLLELGDCFWYAIAIAQHTDCAAGTTREAVQLSPDDGEATSHDLMIFAGKAADRIKKSAWHGKPLDLDALTDELCAVTDCLEDIGKSYGFSRDDIGRANMAKLDARYPGGKFVEGGGVRDEAADKGRSLPHVRR